MLKTLFLLYKYNEGYEEHKFIDVFSTQHNFILW